MIILKPESGLVEWADHALQTAPVGVGSSAVADSLTDPAWLGP